MTARILSVGVGDRRPLALLYLVPRAQPPGRPHLDDQIRAALPGATIIAYSDADGESLHDAELRARAAGWSGGPLVLIGYSAGCLRCVRQLLLDGADASVIVAIDGTHAGLPPTTWQLDAWRRPLADARAGRRLFVATCTQQVYVEGPAARPRYQATVTTLRQVTDWPLLEAGPLPLGVERSEGDAHVHSYESAAIDGPAHSAQLLTVLPEMLRRYVGPWLERTRPAYAPTPPNHTPAATRMLRLGDTGPDVAAWQHRLHALGYDAGAIDECFDVVTDGATRAFQADAGLVVDGVVGPLTRAAAEQAPSIPPPRPTYDSAPPDLGAALLEQAKADLRARVHEDLGRNDGVRIREYFAGTGTAPPANWCAAAVRCWLRAAAARVGVEPPIVGSVGAQATMTQLRRARRWISAAELRRTPERLRSGMIAVWDRSDPERPDSTWWGHIGIVSVPLGDGRWTSLEANSGVSGDAVAVMNRDVDDARLLGAGWID